MHKQINLRGTPCPINFVRCRLEIEKLNNDIGLPGGLKEMGVTEDMIPDLVAHSMTDPSNATTPRLPTQEEWEELFIGAM